MKKEVRIIQIGISFGAVIFTAVHIIWPNLAIDGITLTLLVLAIIPWLAPLIKSLELPGGVKFEFQDLEKIQQKIEKVGLLSPETKSTYEFSFQSVAEEDPNLALAGLRIEIEKRLKKIAELKNISAEKKGVAQLLTVLSRSNILANDESSVIADLIYLLNNAVHGARLDERATKWAIEIGPRLLKGLDKRLNI